MRDFKGLLIKYAGPRPSEKVRGDGSVPFMPTRPGMGSDRVEPNADVKYFYDEIIPWLKQNSETAGKPGVDYDATKFVPGFYNSVPIRHGDTTGIGDAYSNGKNGIILGNTPYSRTDSTLVHELKHQQNNDGFWYLRRILNPFSRGFWRKVWAHPQSGRSKADDALLKKVYRFTPENMKRYNADALFESGTTNAEYQFQIMKDLQQRLGRYPTPQEFKQHVMKMPSDEVLRYFNHRINAYQGDALRESRKARDTVKEKYVGPPLSPGKSGMYPDSMYSRLRVGYGDGAMSLDDARKTDWYKANPTLFEEDFNALIQNHAKYPHATISIIPGHALDNELRKQQAERSAKYDEENPEYSEEDIEAIRKAWGNVAHNSQGMQKGMVRV